MKVKSIRDLAPVHRTALRYIGGEKDLPQPSAKTVRKLAEAGLVKTPERSMPIERLVVNASLTEFGEAMRHSILSSGDGPEALKARLRF